MLFESPKHSSDTDILLYVKCMCFMNNNMRDLLINISHFVVG